jgi:hypothetical protein
VTLGTRVTIGSLKFSATFAMACLFLAVSCAVKIIAVTRLTHVDLVPALSARPIELVHALVTIDSGCFVLAILANTAALISAVNIQRQSLFIDLLRVNALVRVTVAVARLAPERTDTGVLAPLLLLEALAASIALDPASVVLTRTGQNSRVISFGASWI